MSRRFVVLALILISIVSIGLLTGCQQQSALEPESDQALSHDETLAIFVAAVKSGDPKPEVPKLDLEEKAYFLKSALLQVAEEESGDENLNKPTVVDVDLYHPDVVVPPYGTKVAWVKADIGWPFYGISVIQCMFFIESSYTISSFSMLDSDFQGWSAALQDYGDGFFVFTPEKPVEHRFRADLGAGHVAMTTLPAEDVAAILGKPVIETPPPAVTTDATNPAAVAGLTAEERDVIAEAVRDEIRPLRREIAAYKEKNDLQTILGGLGYILGLFGLGFYTAARRKMAV